MARVYNKQKRGFGTTVKLAARTEILSTKTGRSTNNYRSGVVNCSSKTTDKDNQGITSKTGELVTDTIQDGDKTQKDGNLANKCGYIMQAANWKTIEMEECVFDREKNLAREINTCKCFPLQLPYATEISEYAGCQAWESTQQQVTVFTVRIVVVSGIHS